MYLLPSPLLNNYSMFDLPRYLRASWSPLATDQFSQFHHLVLNSFTSNKNCLLILEDFSLQLGKPFCVKTTFDKVTGL